MSTYGQVRMQLTQLCPGETSERLDGWIQDAYTEILDRLEWKRSEAESVIQVPQSYAVGTIAVTQGSAAIVGTGTAWTTALDGFMIRFDNQSEYYQFACTNGTTATLDRPYEAPDNATVTYRIDQALFLLPSLCRIVRGVKPLHDRFLKLKLITPAELDSISISRNSYGVPRWCAPTWDNFSNPPRMQLEFFPIPQSPANTGDIPSFAVDHVLDVSPLDADQTSTTLLPWVRPSALKESVQGYRDRNRASQEPEKAAALLNSSMAHDKKANDLVTAMAQINARQRGPSVIKFASELKRPQHDGRDRSHAPFKDGAYGWD